MLKRSVFIGFIVLTAWLKPGAQTYYYAYTVENFRSCKEFNERINVQNPEEERLNAVVFYLTNEIRKSMNLSVLNYHILLEESATMHSKSMVKYDYFDHINPKSRAERNPNDRAKVTGITNPYLAENIMETFVLEYTAGQEVYPGDKGVFRIHPDTKPIKPHTYLTLGEALLLGWMNSPIHKENIISSQAKELGCGSAFYSNKDFNYMPTVIATQNFQLYEPARTTKK